MDKHTVSLFAGIAALTVSVGYISYVTYSTGKEIVDDFFKWKKVYPNTAKKLADFMVDPTTDGLEKLLDPQSERN